MNNMELLNYGLQLIGAFSLGYALYRGGKYLWERKPVISLKNPLKTYIRKEVINYLKELEK